MSVLVKVFFVLIVGIILVQWRGMLAGFLYQADLCLFALQVAAN